MPGMHLRDPRPSLVFVSITCPLCNWIVNMEPVTPLKYGSSTSESSPRRRLTFTDWILVGFIVVVILVPGIFLAYREFLGTQIYYTREGKVVEKWTWSAPLWSTNASRPAVTGSYEQDFETPTGVVIRIQLKTGVASCDALGRRPNCLPGHFKTPVAMEILVARNPVSHNAALLYEPRVERGEKRLPGKFGARVLPRGCSADPNQMKDDPQEVLSIDCGVQMLTPVGSYPEPETLGERIELSRQDILEVRLHGDGRMTVLNSRSTVVGRPLSMIFRSLMRNNEEFVIS